MQTDERTIRDLLPAGAILPGDDAYDAGRISRQALLMGCDWLSLTDRLDVCMMRPAATTKPR